MPNIFISPHNKIAYIFSILTILLGASIILGHISTSYGAEIVIIPEPEEIDVNFRVQIVQNQENISDEDQTLTGNVLETIQSVKNTYTAEATVSMEDYAEGEITLTNDTFSPINFVASTRFASPDGLIFRATNRVHIPTKGTTTARVRADQMGPDYDIGATTFTIPGLKSPALIENITAISEQAMTGGLKKTGIVMQADIDNAEKVLYDTLYAQGVDEIEQRLYESNSAQTGLKIVIKSQELEKQTNAVAGQEKAEFTSTLTLKIGAVAFREKELLDSAISQLKKEIPEYKMLAAYDPESLSYRLSSYDPDKGQAELEAQLRGYMVLNAGHEILEKVRLRNLSKPEAQTYLENFKEIKSVDINLRPPFILKKVPHDIGKIDVTIKKIN
ncbi:baseplate J/gp47 family protein [Patescibacteria group bacterium AH-259-L05]|nr:baseplate J/gp47 family protein [Patescibacteria group bacterium AH-259-L05]